MTEVDYITGEMITEVAMGITFDAKWEPTQLPNPAPHEAPADECPVCLETMYGKYTATTRCGHTFHRNCFLRGVIDHEYSECYACKKSLEKLKRSPPTETYHDLD